jgi:hypothetical protein
MPKSTVRVQRADGTPVEGVRVVLAFAVGHSDPERTDHDGTVTIAHASSGQATIFVDGRERGSFRAPGAASVTL